MFDHVMRLLVFGGTGMIGSRFVTLQRDAFDIIAPDRTAVDLLDEVVVRHAVHDVRPDAVLYTAGFSRMDAAEQDPAGAMQLNAEAPRWIAEAAAEQGIPVCYLSTDAVFSGRSIERAYREDDEPDPLSSYGKSKRAGELAILRASHVNVVVRLISAYSAAYQPRQDFARRMITDLRQGLSVEGITGTMFNPSFIDRIVPALAAMLRASASGVYHVGAIDGMSNDDFARLLAVAVHANPLLVTSVPFDAFWRQRPHAAPRGAFTWLDTAKFRHDFGESLLTTNEQSVKEFVAQLSSL